MTDLAHLQRPRATCCQAISKSQSVDSGRWSTGVSLMHGQ